MTISGSDTASQQLDAIAERIRTEKKCGLCAFRTNAVPGSGSAHAEIVFIGEGPGEQEDKQGLPFVGSAGKLLDELLAGINLKRENVFITNVVKCRPPGNRDPLPEEVAACWPYLKAQMNVIKPKLIILLGKHAMNRFLPNLKISEAHGKPKRYKGQVYLPLYHPAAALYQGSLRSVLQKDFQNIPAILNTIKSLPAPEPTYDEPIVTDLEAKPVEKKEQRLF